ncbi:MAG TPA: hypothetical protein PLO61_04205 [Fimbriimonadaceae bacterium]|nr:hypothetical protein [Fimbriimonadaceae bacterium]HRJ32835.1 hypothetical protein [Fimbriimonadaceae bacterium]
MWWLFGFVSAAAGLIVWRAYKAKLPLDFSLTEYWVYLPEARLPTHEAILDRMVGNNPHTRPGKPCIGAAEGLVFSDVRLYVNVGLRSKNPRAFRPDLMDRVEGLSEEVLNRLAEAQGIVQIRYISLQKLADLRHLQFLPHMADAIASLGRGTVIYDSVLGRIWTAEEFFQKLESSPRTKNPGFHVELRWTEAEGVGCLETRGLLKAGLWELRTDPLPVDQEVLGRALIEQLLTLMWAKRSQQEPVELEAFGDPYRATLRRDVRERVVQVSLAKTTASAEPN